MIILKLGGSVITRKDASKPTLDPVNLDRIAQEIARANVGELIIIHGAGSFGHLHARKYEIGSPIKTPEELERKKSELEAALNQEIKKNETKVLINETTVENDTENTDKFEKKSDDRQKSIKEDDEIEYYSYDEVVKKERNKWIFIAVASILITIGISASYMNIQKEKNEKLLRTEIEEAQKEAKENAEAIAKIEMEKKLAEETQKIKDHVEEEARKNAILNSVAQNQDVAKENQDKKVDSGIGIEIPKIDTKQIEELNKKAKETQKNIEDLIEKKDGIVGFYNEITTKFNAMLKSVESFFSNLIGDSETKDEKKEENKK